MNKPQEHIKETAALAAQLKPADIFSWIVSHGYFPESYVIPPCFCVSRHPAFGKYFSNKKTKQGIQFGPKTSMLCELHFPKSKLTDRTFGIIDPEIHNDIAYEIAKNWSAILDLLFAENKRVYSYSFPIPISSKKPGKINKIRAGRMIYEWITMVENDLVEEAYQYKYIAKTDIKNFYPAVYTHSIAWAIHTKEIARQKRRDFSYFGNKLDKLFQYANDGCTNGLPIGPVVSDLIAEIILSAVDRQISETLQKKKVLAVRYKDDYRFLGKDEGSCSDAIKSLQKGLRAYNLSLNEEKTKTSILPEGIFRKWNIKYQTIKPKEGRKLSFKEFKTFYINILQIDNEYPDTGLVDRFLHDLISKDYEPLLRINEKNVPKVVSLLLLLAERRIKAFPKILALIEAIMDKHNSSKFRKKVETRLNNHLKVLNKNSDENRYLIVWIIYFMKTNNLKLKLKFNTTDPILKTICHNRNAVFKDCKDFKIYRGIAESKRGGSLLKYLDTFKPQ